MKLATVKATKGVSSSTYIASKYLFLFGLAFITFEQVRPGGIMLADYFFLLSIIFLPKARLKEIGGSGVLLASGLLLIGAVLSVYYSRGWGEGAGNLAVGRGAWYSFSRILRSMIIFGFVLRFRTRAGGKRFPGYVKFITLKAHSDPFAATVIANDATL